MRLSYPQIIEFIRTYYRTFIGAQIICATVAGSYFFMAPKIYEAYFSISLPKVTINSPNKLNTIKPKLIISPQEFIKSIQDPLAYSNEIMAQCMGLDSNHNRKKFIKALRLGVHRDQDVISFNLQLENRDRLEGCAKTLMYQYLNQLENIQINFLKGQVAAGNVISQVSHPEMMVAVRMSDSFVKPDLMRLLIGSALGGLFFSFFIIAMRKKYLG